MKFSKKLYERAHPKYREHYIAYKELKKLIKLITVTTNFGSIRALSGTEYKSTESRFQDILNAELDKINTFTLNIIKDWFKECTEIRNFVETKKEELSLLDIENVQNKLIELGNTLIFLENYKNINFIGFRKITKKFDKHSDKNVSSFFYISVVIKSFFMNYDVNFLVCILSICYKYYRIAVSTAGNLDRKASSADRKVLSADGSNKSNNEVKHKDKSLGGHTHSGTNEMGEDVHVRISENDMDPICRRSSFKSGEAHIEGGTPIEEEALIEVDNNNTKIKNIKYIVKLQHLTSVKVEIAKKFTIKYYDLEEDKFFPSVKNFIEIIYSTKIRNYLVTIYFDDPTLSTYHNFVNRNISDVHQKHIRIRSYNYVNYLDAEKEAKKTVLQKFNIYEPSHDRCEKYVFLKDVPSDNLEVECVKDLLNKYREEDANHYYAEAEGKKKNSTNTDRPMTNGKKEEEGGEEKKKKNITKRKEKISIDPIKMDETIEGYTYSTNDQQNDITYFINEIEKKKFRSIVKSKLNRLYFGDEHLTGYIDENICYWAHNDKKGIHKNSESDDDLMEKEDTVGIEDHSSGVEELNEQAALYTIPSKDQVYEENRRSINKNNIIASRKENKKYSYFDYAVIDISTKEHMNRDFIYQLNNLSVLREIWGYSSFLQGVSLLFPGSTSTFPHWRIYTYTDFMKSDSFDNKTGKKQKDEKGKKRKKKKEKGGEKEGGEKEGEEKEGEEKEGEEKEGEEKEGENLMGREDHNDDDHEDDDDTDNKYNNGGNVPNDSDISLSGNINNYAEQMKQKSYKVKDEQRKSITYTGASARIAHESEVFFRNEIEKNRPSVHHADFHLNCVNESDGNYIGRGYNLPNCGSNSNRGNSNNLKNNDGKRNSYCSRDRYEQRYSNTPRNFTMTKGPMEKENNLYEPLLDSMDDDVNFVKIKSSSGRIISFFKSLFLKKKDKTFEMKKPKNSVVRVEPKTFFANERTLLQWLNTSVLLSTISITLLNFSNSYGFVSGIIMAPVAIFFILYSFHIYLKRAEALIHKEPINYTDKVGPGVLVITLTFALSTVVLLNIYSRLKDEV
ncbi:vacuolar transporter chaperone, putative [Plasmodium malariae]|uniref:Vacuolar transporter chaperone, putative n=1 Tax=Plasmodium malariae TaxID=5858 RepID=A0A1C3L331_PLAMA|nr:vacuolar transporter chaperone, putative [Plasmodium malariae]